MENDLGKLPKFIRNNSQICPSPEDELFAAVLQNDVDKIQILVRNNPKLLEHIYSPEYNKPILSIACQNLNVNARTVKVLLDLGANPNFVDPIDGLEAIHLAAQKTDSNTLKVLLEKYPDAVNSLTKNSPGGNNALHILIRYGDSNSPEFLKCAEALISYGINVNQGDSKFISPIFWAAKKEQRDIIKLIIDKGGYVDLDSHKLRGQTARDLILEKKLYDGTLPPPVAETDVPDKEVLFRFLKQRDEDSFISYKTNDTSFRLEEIVDETDGNSTFLQMACEKGLTKIVRYLVEHGADPSRTGETGENLRMPIMIAAGSGYSEIFEILLNYTDPPASVLHVLLANIDDNYHDTRGCYDLLMKKLKKQWESGNRNDVIAKINEKNISGNTPLHYAVRYSDKQIILDLLNLGASLGSKNNFGFMPVEDIDVDILEEYLDSCVKFDLKKKTERDFAVTFDYRSLIPPYLKKSNEHHRNKFDVEMAKLDDGYKSQLVSETEVIYSMSTSQEYRHLLMHPVIISFLFMKWKRIQWIFHLNLFFYITFSMSLIAYVFADYLDSDSEKKSIAIKVFGKISYTVFLVGFFLLILREVFQAIVAPLKYIKTFENYIELCLVLVTGVILFTYSHDAKKEVASIAILLAVFESMLMLGPHPYFSSRVEMLKVVSTNFFKFLIWYIWLVIAFALSFYILYTPDTNRASINSTDLSEQTEKSNDGNTQDNNFFESPGKSVFKTFIMLTGEFDSSDLDFQTFPITSTVIFALFIFMIAIILLNLLNGLAVSDTQMIKDESELIGHVVRAYYVRHIETLLERNIFPVGVLERLRNVCCCFPMTRYWNCKVGKLFKNTAYLFPNYLNYELTFYPDKLGLIRLPQKNYDCSMCDNFTLTHLDKETVKRTNTIIQALKKDGKSKLELEIEIIKDKLDNILQSINQKQQQTS